MSLQMPRATVCICLLASVLWHLCKPQGQTGWGLFIGDISSPPQNPKEGLTLGHPAVSDRVGFKLRCMWPFLLSQAACGLAFWRLHSHHVCPACPP